MKHQLQNQFKSYCFVIMFEDNTFLDSSGYGFPFSLDTKLFQNHRAAHDYAQYNCKEDELSYQVVTYEVIYTKINYNV